MPGGGGGARWSAGEMALWGGALILATVVLVVAWMLIRRWQRRTAAETGEAGPIWSLQQLRELKAQGQITDAEYAKLAARTSAALKQHGT